MASASWNTLATRLVTLPLILAGPILRQVTKSSVTVWVALRERANVQLTVYDGRPPQRTLIGNAARDTTAIGTNLHIVAVTLRAPVQLVEGHIYFYDLHFKTTGSSVNQGLVDSMTAPGQPQKPERIVYPPFDLPSFVMPPADLNNVRLIQGSCRKPNGGTKDMPTDAEKPDALAMLDQLIEDSKDLPFQRPHQLLLTGDQIYADEVADVLLELLTDAGDTLMGWREELPGDVNEAGKPFGPYLASDLLPTTRTKPIHNARFTTQDTRSHLMSLSEYIAMYLFAWSDELFIPTPTVDEFIARYPTFEIGAELHKDMETQRLAVEEYRRTVPAVRRALANIPTYMICDDHEITDDWNMSRSFCDAVYANKLGTRIIQNGLIAFAVCQAWGNVPEQFSEGSKAAGALLLKSIEAVTQIEAAGNHVYHAFDGELQQRVGLHTADVLAGRSPYGVFHDLDPFVTVDGVSVSQVSLRYNFTVEGPSYQVIVTDSRTWRQFPEPGAEAHPHLIGEADLRRQLQTDAPPLADRLLLIVVTTNAPPIASIREAAFLGGVGNRYAVETGSPLSYQAKKFIYDNDINDSWEFPALATDRLFAVVSDKLPNVGDTLTGQAIFLSGDVHFSFASRLAYWADVQRLGDTGGNRHKVKAVFAQLVASALKNEKDDTRGLQRDGYGYVPKSWMHHVSWPFTPAGYVGWNILPGAPSRSVGRLPAGWIQSGLTMTISADQPTLVVPLGANNNATLSEKPDYRYRLDYLHTAVNGQTVPPPPTLPQTDAGDSHGALRSRAKANSAHRDLIKAGADQLDIVGANNLSEISFVWQRADGSPASSANDPLATRKFVRHMLRWQRPGAYSRWARYDVSLSIDDPVYQQLRAHQEQP